MRDDIHLHTDRQPRIIHLTRADLAYADAQIRHAKHQKQAKKRLKKEMKRIDQVFSTYRENLRSQPAPLRCPQCGHQLGGT